MIKRELIWLKDREEIYKENQKKYRKSIVEQSTHEVVILSFFIVLLRWIFYYKNLSSNFENPKCTVQ